MTGKTFAAAVCALALAPAGFADGTASLPPLALPASDGALNGGKTVSRPLQPIEIVEVQPPAELPKVGDGLPSSAEMERAEAVHPLGNSWQEYDLLVWWPKGQPLPPLVTAGRGTTPPVLGGPNTLLLVGRDSWSSPDIAGARFEFGGAVNESQTAGLGVTYFFLGTRTETLSVTDVGTGRPRYLARPIVNPITGRPDVIPVSIPGHLTGGVDVSTTTRATGWEITGVVNLYAGPGLRLNALAGYRYFMVNEGLRVEQATLFFATPKYPVVAASLADQFDAHNRFHGGQLGLRADLTRGPVFIEATGKVGLGEAINVVRVSGQSVAVVPGTAAIGVFDGGVLGQPSNAGRFVRSSFAVLPEAIVKVGYRFRDRSRFYVGYNFLYLSEAVRAGDQVDPVVDPSQVPLFAPAGQVGTADRPAPVVARSDFWLQGLVFGLEYRY